MEIRLKQNGRIKMAVSKLPHFKIAVLQICLIINLLHYKFALFQNCLTINLPYFKFALFHNCLISGLMIKLG